MNRAVCLALSAAIASGGVFALQATAQDQAREGAAMPLPAPRPAPEQTLRPEPDIPLPQERPEAIAQSRDDAGEEGVARDAAPQSIATQLRRYQQACPAVLSGRVVATLRPPRGGEGCRLQSPLSVSAIAVGGREITLDGTPTLSCAMASGLADWVEAADRGAQTLLDARIARVSTGPGYSCRLRNNAETGFISEHGFGNAADILGVTLSDGRTVRVREDWVSPPDDARARFLDYAQTDACTRFTTVLGPQANAAHENHFHFDLGCHGQDCTARICE